jgi:hypothetical protein
MTWRNPLSNQRFISKGRDYHLSRSLRQTTSRYLSFARASLRRQSHTRGIRVQLRDRSRAQKAQAALVVQGEMARQAPNKDGAISSRVEAP